MPNTLQEHITYTRNEWSKEYYKEIIDFLKDKKIESFIDLGGCVGEVSLILLEQIDTIKKCYIVEPVKENYEFILNRFSDKNNVEVYNFAIYYGLENISMGQISQNDINVGGWSFSDKHSVLKTNLIPTKTLEDIPLCDFIKIDIEGSEVNLLTNSNSIGNFKYIALETHDALRNDYENFISDKLPNHKIIFSLDEQIFLEKK